DVAETYPTKLPPLRSDVPTLVVGRLNSAGNLSYSVSGTVAGHDVQVQGSETVPVSEVDNFFLVGMVEQWKSSKDRPALTRSDRALADAQTRSRFTRDDLVAQAEVALASDRLDVAKQLFDHARKLDPSDAEAKAGLDVVEGLKGGRIQKQDLKAQLAKE